MRNHIQRHLGAAALTWIKEPSWDAAEGTGRIRRARKESRKHGAACLRLNQGSLVT